jgi:thiamine-phosphate pyrophosphorylase
MRRRHAPLPTLWLMTDERVGDALWPALAALPRGSGVVFRHHATPSGERRALFDRVRRIARARRLLLLLAGPPTLARAWRADGWHGRSAHVGGLHSAPAHDTRELVAARRAGAAFAFLSPVFATRSHPGAKALGVVRFGLLARGAGMPVVALGGMTRANVRRVRAVGASGWAAIDGLTPP